MGQGDEERRGKEKEGAMKKGKEEASHLTLYKAHAFLQVKQIKSNQIKREARHTHTSALQDVAGDLQNH